MQLAHPNFAEIPSGGLLAKATSEDSKRWQSSHIPGLPGALLFASWARNVRCPTPLAIFMSPGSKTSTPVARPILCAARMNQLSLGTKGLDDRAGHA